MEYNFRAIEKKWQKQWEDSHIYHVSNDSPKPKCYVLDMFPYPSGAGLHVGHPLGYIATDIYARYKRLKGFNVLHTMGYDAFGLPTEQYALETGQHPVVTTEQNINAFRQQLNNIGFCYDWSREVNTSDPSYYKWTQWIFLQLFESWYDRNLQKALPIKTLEGVFEQEGNKNHVCPGDRSIQFTAEEWKQYDEVTRRDILMQYRLAYLAYAEVNWCEALGTVLANDEVINGVSERGGYPVVKKKMRQWFLRITEYANRLLEGLETVNFSDAMKEMQRNWIGKSQGAEIKFNLKNNDGQIEVYTTRPDTIFGVDFMVLAPEHELVSSITTPEQKEAVEKYLDYVQSRSERERMAEVKQITGCFTGAYAINPFNGREIPVWIAEYVLAGYGTGAIMAVPCGDQRDFGFARHFNIPITNIIGDAFNGTEANPTKDAKLQNSGFLDGMEMRPAMDVVINKLEEMGIGRRQINYKMRDAGFSRQRYWGEPFPIVYRNGVPYAMDEKDLPVELPYVENYKPGPDGEGPLANITDWVNIAPDVKRETNTMPGYAGSSWYFLRYMDPHNKNTFADRKATDYWNQVDVYVGGTEHAVGHLLYSRLWTKVLYDLGYLGFDEPFKSLINQGMIGGSSRLVYRIHGTNQYVSHGLKDQYQTDALHVDVNIVDGVELDIEALKKWKPEFADATFILEDGKYICGVQLEKMSKRLFNTVNPNDLVNKYGADTFRMYEMFLGPVEQSKPWDTKGIEGVHRFLKKLWRLFADEQKGIIVNEQAPTPEELKILHKTIQKIDHDTNNFSFNTAVSSFMICVNELASLNCHKRAILEPLLVLLTPYAPHLCEELWQYLGHNESILNAIYPVYEEKYTAETAFTYPIAINGKTRTEMSFDLNLATEEIEKAVLANPVVEKWMEGKSLKRMIIIKGKMINVVI
ncbi:leucyl-tRNA synthetase [Chitinophaga terrae (ex Kim and Jung 2007)]|uniref:Leucine--tRNA ligase n=1 Tax=Chitinophaga terrae (ex Kim and Jung 2007) TaxID=408074 RepID=A0A1H3Y7P6_9BACT|nr:leucine--tRNA ligase [Chitinophaga terrae (ex Kim and Jung 2007)]MDQ0107992.1 leucyl-tRNA synthetase [Chitinophaga terrae (ex Kim and Jung 2007)]GEP90921.1 leucine--tRNA ligase [Chitinophaga terrae (ex Kim and Jung 2007)]SEA06924.1 leucyl-tRNA synthetase [Chitinophaga terrae (ex Kim and Jung 2007)]